MSHASFPRRDFLKLAASAAVAGGATSTLAARGADDVSSEGGMKKAVKFGMVQTDGSILEKFRLLKELGFDGVELDGGNHEEREEFARARDESGLPIHGVVYGASWGDQLSHPDPEVRSRGVAGLRRAIEDSNFYGGTTVLLIPGVVSKEVSYDAAYERSQPEIRKALPLAEELGVTIAIENVWNNFLVSPLETARYIDEIGSPRFGAYFDIGNVLRYGWPEQWIRILGPRIVKLDIKEYSLQKQQEEGLFKGFVDLWEGDCDWPAVMAALREIGFTSGWGTAEIAGGGRERLVEIAEKMDRIWAS